MHDYNEDNLVVYSNQLIKSVWRMNATTIKLFAMAVSCIDTLHPPKDLTIRLSKKDIFNAFGLTGNSRYTDFRQHIQNLQHQSVLIPVDQSGKRVNSVVPVPGVKWGTTDDDDLVEIRFDQDIMPYLIDLRSHFTQFQISQLNGLRGKYAMILFQYLTMQLNMKKDQLKGRYRPEKGVSWSLSVADLRKMTDTEKDYPQFERFDFRVLKQPLSEINGIFLPILCKYEKVKKGRKITEIKFFVRERQSFSDTDFDHPKSMSQPWEPTEYERKVAEGYAEILKPEQPVVVLSPELEEVFLRGKEDRPTPEGERVLMTIFEQGVEDR